MSVYQAVPSRSFLMEELESRNHDPTQRLKCAKALRTYTGMSLSLDIIGDPRALEGNPSRCYVVAEEYIAKVSRYVERRGSLPDNRGLRNHGIRICRPVLQTDDSLSMVMQRLRRYLRPS